MGKDEIKTYYKNQNVITMKNGEIIRIQSIRGDNLEVDDRNLDEVKDKIVKDYKDSNFCGECGKKLSENDKYYPYCGTRKGEGKFLPFLNEILCVYGPAIKNYYKCKVCKHKWSDYFLKNEHCPKCGSPNIILKHKLVGDLFFDEDIPIDNTYLSLIKYKIKKKIVEIKRKLMYRRKNHEK